MSATIDSPTPSPPSVGRTFTAEGDYDLTDIKDSLRGEVKVCSWVVWQGQEISRKCDDPIPDPAMLPQGRWDVEHTVDNDYADCTVYARVFVDNVGAGGTGKVEHVDIEEA